jgi:metal-dependent HD superfamily phosphatase/phosphodiesterase
VGRNYESNSAGIYQVDELFATHLSGSGLKGYIDVIVRIDADVDQSLISGFKI